MNCNCSLKSRWAWDVPPFRSASPLSLSFGSVVFPWPKHTLTGEEWRSHMPSSDTAVKLGWTRASSSFKKKFISIFGLDFRRPGINNSVCLQFSVSSFTFIVWNNVASTFHGIPFSVEIPFCVSLLFARMIIIKKLPNRWNAAFSNVTQVRIYRETSCLTLHCMWPLNSARCEEFVCVPFVWELSRWKHVEKMKSQRSLL